MRQRLIPIMLALCLLCSCAAPSVPAQQEQMTVVATTYPIYVLASALTQGMEGVRVQRLNTGSVSCLHDYTLSVGDMKKLEGADVIALNGVELEEFMEDALERSDAAVINCSEGVELLESMSHYHHEAEEEPEDDHDHDHGHDHGHWDPHYWMDPENAGVMAANLAAGLGALDESNAQLYAQRAQETAQQMDRALESMEAQALSCRDMITFHDGFQYFAHAFDLHLLEAIEEEAGSEASAKEIVEITHLVNEHGIPAIFTEENGSEATAKAISRETGCRIGQLSMVMDGPEVQADWSREEIVEKLYLTPIRENLNVVVEVFG